MTEARAVRLVCVAPDTVVPPISGSAARTYGLAAAVRPHLDSVEVRCFSSGPAPTARAAGLDVVHIPRPSAGAARVRYLATALLGRRLGYQFPPASLADGRRLIQLASPLLFEGARRAGLKRFVLDAHNVYRDMTAFPQASLRDRVFYRLTRQRQARMEAECWAAASHVFFCSTVDQDRAERLAPGITARSTVVPNCVDTRGFTPRPDAAFAGGGPVLFIGTTRYPPNFFAVQEICHQIAPALPDLPFWIVGDAPYRPARIPGNVRFLGRVEATAEPLGAARVAVAPVRHGSGTRLKLLEYFAAGLPVVCTAKSAEGLEVVDGTHVRLAETSTAFVEAIRDVHGDARASATLGAAARALVEARYDWRAWVPGLLEVYVAQAPAC
jgi:glycosyltransferase involved in cell wall biosynthesis